MKKPATPCYNCTDRVPGCHSTCERYKDFKENGTGYKNMISENKSKYYTIEACERWRARRKHEQFRRRDGKKV